LCRALADGGARIVGRVVPGETGVELRR
jgi:hypothetical protein